MAAPHQLVGRTLRDRSGGPADLAELPSLLDRFGFAAKAYGHLTNEDSKLVLLGHCFEDLELHRVEWQVDGLNERSIAALNRLGFHYEGTHRSRHVRPDGSRRDSLYFSLLAAEWPACRVQLLELIDQKMTKRNSL